MPGNTSATRASIITTTPAASGASWSASGNAAYRQLLSQAGMRQSMSARANPYHNAWTESFMGTLKSEMLEGGCFLNDQDARIEIFSYIESYYNTHRRHSSLGYKTPAQFETLI